MASIGWNRHLRGAGHAGAHRYGHVFDQCGLIADPGGAYTETLIHNFDHGSATFNGGHGCALTLDPDTGYLLGTAAQAGDHGYGALWDLAPPAAGQTAWTYSIVHSFTSSRPKGWIAWVLPVRPPQ